MHRSWNNLRTVELNFRKSDFFPLSLQTTSRKVEGYTVCGWCPLRLFHNYFSVVVGSFPTLLIPILCHVGFILEAIIDS